MIEKLEFCHGAALSQLVIRWQTVPLIPTEEAADIGATEDDEEE